MYSKYIYSSFTEVMSVQFILQCGIISNTKKIFSRKIKVISCTYLSTIKYKIQTYGYDICARHVIIDPSVQR